MIATCDSKACKDFFIRIYMELSHNKDVTVDSGVCLFRTTASPSREAAPKILMARGGLVDAIPPQHATHYHFYHQNV